jgi:nucleoside-diphosphate-sugar epimerase
MVRNAYLNNSIVIQDKAVRNLLDIDDVVKIVNIILEKDSYNNDTTLNIASSSYIRVWDIAIKIKSLLHSDTEILSVPGGEEYYIENEYLKSIIGNKDSIFSVNYAMDVLEKYTSKIKTEFSSCWEKNK